VFILNYDENDGLFDHVVPPTAPPGTPGEYLTDSPLAAGSDGFAGPIGGGFRVPCLIISPWTMGGWIASETFDHTSTLQFLEQLTGVTIPNITPWRRQTFGNMSSAFGGFTPGYGWPRLPDTKAALAKAVHEVNNLPAPVVPTADQVLPVQTTGRYPRPRPAK
jgi:phospholipase C